MIETLYASKLEPHLGQLAYHFCEAAPGGDVDKPVGYAERAAERANASLAFEEAASHTERALTALEAREPADETRRCELLLVLAATLLLGRYTGYRLLELYRFRVLARE